MSKKIIGSVMTGALVLSLITPAVPAAPVDAAGKVTYKVKGTTLTISGKGEMPKSMVFGKKSKTKNIKKVVIKKGVTTISKNAFKNCKNLNTITIKSTKLDVDGVKKGAFSGIGKKVVVKVPKSKYSAYKKLLREKGLNKKVKIKKI